MPGLISVLSSYPATAHSYNHYKSMRSPKSTFIPYSKEDCMIQVLPWAVTDMLGYASGGPAGAVYGFLIVWAGLIATFISISEMVSM